MPLACLSTFFCYTKLCSFYSCSLQGFYCEEVWDFVGFLCTYRDDRVISVPKFYLCVLSPGQCILEVLERTVGQRMNVWGFLLSSPHTMMVLPFFASLFCFPSRRIASPELVLGTSCLGTELGLSGMGLSKGYRMPPAQAAVVTWV